MSEQRKLSIETLSVHGGQEIDPTTLSRAVPIYQTTSYGFRDTEHAANLFALKEFGNIYTRIMNPTSDVFEKRIAALEGAPAALAVASGQAAITYSILNIAEAGDEIVSATSLYGGTYNLFANTLPKLGIRVNFVDPSNPANFESAITDKTKALYAETIGNPRGRRHRYRSGGGDRAPARHSADHRQYVPKPLSVPSDRTRRGHRRAFRDEIHRRSRHVDRRRDRRRRQVRLAGQRQIPGLTEPDPSYHGVVYTEAVGPVAYIIKMRVQLLRDMGAALSPFNSFLLLQGLGNAASADGAPQLERAGRRSFPGAARSGGMGQLSGAAEPPVLRPRAEIFAEGARRDFDVRHQRRHRGRQEAH